MINLTKGMKVKYTGTYYINKFRNCKLLTGTIMEVSNIDGDYIEYTVKFDDKNFNGHNGLGYGSSYCDNTFKSWFVLGKELTPVYEERGDNID